ncbi:signal peptidase I [Aequitasia blattaphilus]|uniref:Signal peptidase I n=1 Tax=Aequitasia blattaphilus TaxID=2949332 RepID=A0ABT1E6Z4_9FIRM|nr:signal peptidase I [Aequitasia blattaphilus]MCP1101605.1 signal peptidase I [Aequitasia blattaphilus]MCR8614245.1 signal peptidase I [Aequitasia blattaphilus]
MKVKRRKKKLQFDVSYISLIAKWIFKIFVTLLFAFVFVWYFGQRVSVVGDSMNPILHNGDITMVNRIVYNAMSPKRGDIIAFKPKGNEDAHYYIKRIVGLPGETIEVIESKIYVDGKKINESYEPSPIEEAGVLSEKVRLGNDEYFVLGDNRNNSEDSRSADIGNVKRDYIYGKVWFIASPSKHFGFVRSK